MLITRIHAGFRHFFYFFRQAGRNFKIGGLSTIIAVISIACSLLLICLYLLVSSNLSPVLDLARNIEVVLYLKENISPRQISHLQQKLAGFVEVSEARYISKTEALEKFRRMLKKDAILLDGLAYNPLPASFELSLSHELKDPDLLKSFFSRLTNLPEVDSLQGGGEWVQKLSGLLMAIRLVLLCIGAILTIISLFIIASTIHLTIDNRRDEIIIMRLVGATEWYVRFPFVFEGIMEGFLGGCLALVISTVLYYAFCWEISPLLKLVFGISAIDFFGSREIFLILILGVLVGGLGAILPFCVPSHQMR